MRLKSIILSFLILTIIGCKQRENKKENTTDTKTKIIRSERVPDNLVGWVNAVNGNNTKSIQNSYETNAVKIVSSDSIINSSAKIADYYTIQENKITSIESLFSVEANKERKINYELVRYKIDELKEFIEIVIWRMKGQNVIREFEFTQEVTSKSAEIDTTKIAERRKLWIKLCNSNNAENLVQQLYSSNTIYFNHKPIVQGVKDVIKEYDYMNNINYNLNLQPMKLEVVNANFAYEIGQCSGSYNGKYILVWKKESNGIWKIYIDSNI